MATELSIGYAKLRYNQFLMKAEMHGSINAELRCHSMHAWLYIIIVCGFDVEKDLPHGMRLRIEAVLRRGMSDQHSVSERACLMPAQRHFRLVENLPAHRLQQARKPDQN